MSTRYGASSHINPRFHRVELRILVTMRLGFNTTLEFDTCLPSGRGAVKTAIRAEVRG